jgi:hypothetical protein
MISKDREDVLKAIADFIQECKTDDIGVRDRAKARYLEAVGGVVKYEK